MLLSYIVGGIKELIVNSDKAVTLLSLLTFAAVWTPNDVRAYYNEDEIEELEDEVDDLKNKINELEDEIDLLHLGI